MAILERRSIMVVVMEAMMMVVMMIMSLMTKMRETTVDFFGDGLYFKRLGCIGDING